jgi:RHS repeat-associated protein
VGAPGRDGVAAQREALLAEFLLRGPPERGTAEAPITWLFEPETFAPLARLTGDRRESIVTDYLGTPVTLLDDTGRVTWSADLTAWGNLAVVTGDSWHCPFRWPGQYEDPETGLCYNRFRYYDPESGQYASQDPIRLAGGLSLHRYVHDPATSVDPQGLAARSCGEGEEVINFYHGTTEQGARSIRTNGIDLASSRPNLDFGQGFYTSRDLGWAQRQAVRRAQWLGDRPALLNFRVPAFAFRGLRIKVFPGPTREWDAMIRSQRTPGAPLHTYDVVEGPMAFDLAGLAKPDGFLDPRGTQTSFHTNRAVDMLSGYLL